MDIKNTISIITGGGSGLGAALAAAIVGKGGTVYGLARNFERLQEVQKRLGDAFIPIKLDISREGDVTEWIEKTFTENHRPDILINNAGAGVFRKIEETSLDEWHAMINTNLNGVFYLTSKLVPFMKQSPNQSYIINIGSILGKTTRREAAGYCATKYGMHGFSEVLFKELRSDNIKVTLVNPGSIDTHFFEESGIKSHGNMLQPAEVATLITRIIETPENLLIDEITLRPLNPSSPR